MVEPATGAPGTPFPNENITTRRVKSSGAIDIRGVTYQITRELAGHTIYVAKQAEGVKFYDSNGDLLLEHPWPAPGTKYVSNGRPRGFGSKRPENIRDVIRSTSTDVPPDEYRRIVRTDGRVRIRGVVYGVGKTHAGRPVHAVIDVETVVFCDPVTGEIIAEHPIPEPGTKQPDIAATTASCPSSNPAIRTTKCPGCPEKSQATKEWTYATVGSCRYMSLKWGDDEGWRDPFPGLRRGCPPLPGVGSVAC